MMNVKYFFSYIFSFVFILSSVYSQNVEFEEFKDIPGAFITAIDELSTGELIISTPQGIWKGDSDFSKWIKISSGISDSSVQSLIITQNDIIIAGTPSGLFKSSTMGKVWAKLSNNFSAKEIRHLSIHPNGHIYAGVHKRLYRSKDNGVTWLPFADSLMKLYTSDDLYGVAHYGTANRLFVLMHYSDDDGKTWNIPKIKAGVYSNEVNNSSYILRYINGANNNIYVSINDTVNGAKNGFDATGMFIVSTDNGVSWGWSSYYEGRENGPLSRNVITKEQYHNHFYLKDRQFELKMLPFAADTMMFFPYQGVPILVKPNVFKEQFKDFLTVNLQYKQIKSSGLTSTEISYTKVLKNGTFVLGTYGAGLFYSTNRGKQWNKVVLPIYYPVLTCSARSDTFQKTYIGTTDGLYEYDKNSKKYNEIRLPDSTSKFIIDIAVRPKDGELFFACREGIYRQSGNDLKLIISSKEHSRCNDILFYGDTLMVELVSKRYYSKDFIGWHLYDSSGIFASGGSNFIYYNKRYSYPFSLGPYSVVYYSKIFGYVQINAGLPIFRISTSGSGAKIPAYIFAATEGNNNDDFYLGNEGGVFKLDLSSKGWVQNNKTGLLKDRILALTSNQVGDVLAGALTGAFRSKDKTQTWSKLPLFPNTAVRSLGVDHGGYVFAGLAWGGIYKSKQSSVQLAAPELAIPANKAKEVIIKSDATWKQVPNANGYHIQLSKDSLFTEITTNDSTLGVNVKPMAGVLDINTRYYWRVRATYNNFRGEWSSVRTFTTETKFPEKTLLNKPSNKSVNIPANPLLQWSKSIYSVESHIQLSPKEDFSELLVDDSTVLLSESLINNLGTGTEYFWHVRGRNKAGYGSWSDTWSFTTKEGTNSVRDGMGNEFVTTVNNGILKIENNPHYNRDISLTISDLTGKRVMTLPLEKGTQTKEINISSLHRGYYLVMLESSTGSISKSIIVP